jgi:hypothetical protein
MKSNYPKDWRMPDGPRKGYGPRDVFSKGCWHVASKEQVRADLSMAEWRRYGPDVGNSYGVSGGNSAVQQAGMAGVVIGAWLL